MLPYICCRHTYIRILWDRSIVLVDISILPSLALRDQIAILPWVGWVGSLGWGPSSNFRGWFSRVFLRVVLCLEDMVYVLFFSHCGCQIIGWFHRNNQSHNDSVLGMKWCPNLGTNSFAYLVFAYRCCPRKTWRWTIIIHSNSIDTFLAKQMGVGQE